MARKNKRSQARKPQRGGGTQRATQPGGVAPVAPVATGQQTATPAPASQPAAPASSRMVQRPLPRARGRQQIDPFQSEDASVPMERVPYFRSDIRRIAITAGLMIVLLIAGSIVLRNMLHA